MISFRNLSIGTKLTLLVAISAIGFAMFAAYAFYTLRTVQVNGPVYQELAKDQELVADVLPPPSYIIESYLISSQLLDAAEDGDTATVNTLIEKASTLQTKYETRHAYWVKGLDENSEIGQALLTNSYQPAQTFFQIFNDQFLPAIRSGQVEEAHTIYHDQLTPTYEAHRTAIDEVVKLQNAAITQSEQNAQSLIGNSVTLLILLALLTIGLAVGLGIFVGRSVTLPVAQLTQVAGQIMRGDLEAQARAETTDEVGVLAGAFNQMTAQLRNTLSGLEERVAERTRNLELAAEVGRTVSQVRALNLMLTDAAELIRKQFDLYYVQVYLTDPSQTNLILQSGTGDVGKQLLARNHRLPFDSSSLNGRAAVEKKSVVIADTAQSATFRPNPLLPNTRSEVAIPLVVGEKVVGVLDMQSEHSSSLNEGVLPAFEALAGQLAVAIQNANLLAETEQARAEVEKQAARVTRSNWKDYLDAIHKPEQIGFVYDQNTVKPLDETESQQMSADGSTVAAPIFVTGEALGDLIVELDQEKQTAQTKELINAVARQVAQQIESLRLVESSERYRAQAEEASRRLTREAWQGYAASKSESGLGYMYDLNEVKPHNQIKLNQASDQPIMELPLKVREEVIGNIGVIGLESTDENALNLVNAVTERLSAHIEGLRLTEQTQKRAVELATVAEISTAAATLLNPDELLQAVVDTAKEKFNLYHAHVYLRDTESNQLVLAKGAGEVGQAMVADKWQIAYDHPTSMVARSARTAKAIVENDIVRDVNSTFLSNTLLPNTRSEMAVPMIVGETVLGVFDVQSDVPNHFTDEDINIFNTLAAQVAVSLQNARAFSQAQRQADREATLNQISQKIQGATSVEVVLQVAARELGRALGSPLTIAQLGLKTLSEPGVKSGNNGH